MAQGRIKLGVDFDVNKSGLLTLQNELKKINNFTLPQLRLQGIDISEKELQSLQAKARELQQIFAKSYNFKLNAVDFVKFQENLKNSTVNLTDFSSKISKMGPEAALSIKKLNTELFKTTTALREAHPLLDKMRETFANTIRWSIASTAINKVTGSIQQAWGFTKQLDSALTDIRIVTEKSAEEMDAFARKANEAAKALGASTKEYAKASLIYYQQGLTDQEVEVRTDVTLKAANVTGQDAQAVSEQLTAVWNGYKVSAQESEKYIDKLSAVAAKTAADLEELSTGMSKVASAANIMGVDIDQLNAQLATIVSVTREAPESIGTALKTVYARMSDIESGLDAETTLGEYTKQMAQMGFNALDVNGNLRDMGEVVEEIGNNWNNLSRNQQVALAQTIAGTRQYSRMMALFDNWDMYKDAKSTSLNSEGTLAKQNEIALDSLDKKIQQLTTTTEELFLTLVDSDAFKTLIDGFTAIVDGANDFIKAIGGGRTALLALGAVASSILSNKIGKGISSFISNRQQNTFVKNQRAAQRDTLAENYDEQIKEQIKVKQGAEDNLSKATLTRDKYEEFADNPLFNPFDIQVEKAEKELDKEKEAIENLKKEKAKAIKEFDLIQNMSSEDKEKMNERTREQNKLQEEILNIKKNLETQTAAHNRKIQTLEEQKNIDIENAIKEEVENRKEANKEIIRLEEEKIKKLKELADKEKEKNFIPLQEEQDEARRIALQQARKRDGGKFADTLTVNYKEGAQSRGDYITPETLRERLIIANQEFSSESNKISSLVNRINKGKINSLDAQDEILAEITYLREHRDQLGITDDAWKEYEAAFKEYEKFIKKAAKEAETETGLSEETDKSVKNAANKILSMGKEDITAAQKENKKAQKAFGKDRVATYQQEAKNQKKIIKDIEKAEKESANKILETRKEINKSQEEQQKIAKEGIKEQISEIENAYELEEKNEKEKIALAEQTAATELEIINTENEQLEQAKREALEKAQNEQAAAAVGRMTGAIIQMGAAISMVASLPSIWSDEELSTGEKVFQTLTVVIPAMFSLGGAISTVNKGMIAAKGNIPGMIAGMLGLDAGAKLADVSFKQLGASIWAALTPLLPFIAAIAGAIAVIALVSVAIDKATKAYNADATAAAEAAKRADELAQAYENVKTEYENLKASIEDYHDAQDAIDKLVVGTEEWRDAIAEANDQIMNLIDQYPELAKYINNEAGRLAISEQGLQILEEKKEQEIQDAREASLQGQITANKANLKYQSTNVRRELDGGKSEGEDRGGAIAGSIIIGIVNPWAGIATYSRSQEEINKQIEKEEARTNAIIDAYIKNPEKFANTNSALNYLSKQNIDLSELNLTDESLNAIKDLADATREAKEQNKALQQQIAQSWLSDESVYTKLQEKIGDLDKDYQEGKIENAEYVQNREKLLNDTAFYEAYGAADKFHEGRITDIRNEIGEEAGGIGDKNKRIDLVREYWAKKLGIDPNDITVKNAEGDHYTIEYVGEGGSTEVLSDLSYLDENGQSGLYSLLAEQRAANTEADIDWEDAKARFEALKKFNDTATKAYASFVGDGEGDFSALAREEFKYYSEKWKNKSFDDIKEDDELKQTAEAFGLDTSEEALKTLLENFKKGIENYELQQEKIKAILGDNLEDSAFNLVDQGVQQFYANLKSGLIDSFGKDASNIFKDVFEGLGAEELKQFQLNYESLNWQNPEAVGQFTNTLTEMGIGVDEVGLSTEELVRKLKIAAGAVGAFTPEDGAEGYNKLHEVLSEVKEFGDTISADQYKSLSNDAQKYFLRMADGTYALTKSAEEFYEIVQEGRKEQLFEELKLQQGKYESLLETLTLKELDDAQKIKAYEYAGYSDQVFKEALEEFENIKWDVFNDPNSRMVSWADSNSIWDDRFKNSKNITYDTNFTEYHRALAYLSENSQYLTDTQKALVEEWNGLTSLNVGVIRGIETAFNDVQSGIQDEQNRQREQAESEYIDKLIEEARIELEGTEESRDNVVQQLFSEATNISSLKSIQKEAFEIVGSEQWKDDYYELYFSRIEFLKEAAKNFVIEKDSPFVLIEQKIADISHELDLLQKQGDELIIGSPEAIKNLEKQKQLLKEQTSELEKQQPLANEDVIKKKNNLVSTFSDFNGKEVGGQIPGLPDFTYDEFGNITNLNEVYEVAEAWIKDKYNYDTNKAKEYTSNIKAAVDEYNASLDKVDQIESDLAANRQDRYELNLKYLEDSLSYELDTTEQVRKINEFLRELKPESVDYSSYTEDLNSFKDDYDNILLNIQEAQTAALTPAQFDNLIKENIDKLMSTAQEALSTLEEAEEQRLDLVSQLNEEYQKQIDNYSTIISMAEHQISLTELLYGDKAANRMQNYYSAIKTAQLDSLATLGNQIQANYGQLNNYEIGSDAWDESTQSTIGMLESYGAQIISTIEALQNAYINETDAIIQQFEKTLLAGTDWGSMEALKDEWDWIQEDADRYLDPIDRAYEISSLEAAFNKSINSKVSLSAQNKLNEAKEYELSILKAKEKLEKADIERAQKRLSIVEAEIALQEAQQNKTQMRLTRGQDGRYSYQYVADTNAIEEAQLNLEKATNELYNFDKDRYNDTMSEVYDLYSEWMQKLTDAKADGIITEDEQASLDRYAERIDELAGNTKELAANITTSINESKDALNLITEEDIARVVTNVDTSMVKFVETIADKGFGQLTEGIVSDIVAAANNYQEAIQPYEQTLTNTLTAIQTLTGQVNTWGNTTEISKLNTSIGNLNKVIGGEDGKGGLIGAVDELKAAIVTFINSPKPESGSKELNEIQEIIKDSIGVEMDIDDLKRNYASLIEHFGVSMEVLLDSLFDKLYGASWVGDELMTSLDTGGYTGIWGDKGKLAILHEKEIVLNKTDTENFLQALTVSKDLVSLLTSSMLDKVNILNNIFSPKLEAQSEPNMIEQKVSIEANFPNVTDRAEIEAAFEELINLAAQDAYEDKK